MKAQRQAGAVEALTTSPRMGPSQPPVQPIMMPQQRPVPIPNQQLPPQAMAQPQFIYGPPPVIVMQPNNPQQYHQPPPAQAPVNYVNYPPQGPPQQYPPQAHLAREPDFGSGLTVSYDPNARSFQQQAPVRGLSDRGAAARATSPRRTDLTPDAIEHLKMELTEAQQRNNQLQDRVEWLAKAKRDGEPY